MNRPIPSCEDSYYHDSYAMECLTCSNTVQVAAPLIFVGTIALVVGGVVAYNYRTINTILEEQREAMCVYMNQWTMVVSTNAQVEYECKCVCAK